jgi:phage baseplate assembly protein W
MSGGLQLSDYNYSPATNVAREQLYSDLDLSFKTHPILKDIVPVTDTDAIKNSLKNLIFSYAYSRPFRPYFSANIKNLLFEPNTLFTRINLRDTITRIIRDYEPRINKFDVSVEDTDYNSNDYKITIIYETSYDVSEQTVFYIERLR